jgi:hypothetical protein
MLNLSKVPIMLNLPKLAVIAAQAAVGIALGASWAVTALAEGAPANPVAQSQTTPPVLRGGRAQKHPAHGQIYRTGTDPVQGLVEGLMARAKV